MYKSQNKHLIKHSNDNKFKFDFENCFKFYKRKISLKLHKEKAHLNVRYVCDWSECRKQNSIVMKKIVAKVLHQNLHSIITDAYIRAKSHLFVISMIVAKVLAPSQI
ncbi:unnamed protein product [Oppiella nova]|uniref:C2H2-type domain-containing protein n=1 Tax=Oppiella nova TaxID=334625 RepID=A0A7R9MKZ6_9ACAR|nr:unnamed protein product [Oppiella nova]CAG2178867.1 unnamed protein product [Oppiella nova]